MEFVLGSFSCFNMPIQTSLSVAPKLPVSLRSGENVKISGKRAHPRNGKKDEPRHPKSGKDLAIRWFSIILKCYSHLVALKIASTAV